MFVVNPNYKIKNKTIAFISSFIPFKKLLIKFLGFKFLNQHCFNVDFWYNITNNKNNNKNTISCIIKIILSDRVVYCRYSISTGNVFTEEKGISINTSMTINVHSNNEAVRETTLSMVFEKPLVGVEILQYITNEDALISRHYCAFNNKK